MEFMYLVLLRYSDETRLALRAIDSLETEDVPQVEFIYLVFFTLQR